VPVYAIGDREPHIHPDAYVHPDAVVIGDVTLGAFVSVWPSAVLRADDGRIVVGDRTTVEDGTILRATPVRDTVVGSGCVIGHRALVEAATIGDRVLVGSGSVVLGGATVDDGALVAAGAVVTPGTHVPARRMAVGVPARIRENYLVPADRSAFGVDSYVRRGIQFRAELRRLDPR
jgi:carbonic anhydrase/acetyltransferase-like protein (isoleucine patch superfamily)